ncbi:MAG: DUF721 domain-containing protein [Verrucomicrobiota bacterium]
MLPPPKQRPRPRGAGLSAKQRVLAQWRGVDVSQIEKAQKVCARTVGELVPQVLSGFRIEQKRGEIEIVKVWNDLIDPNVTAHAQPTGLNKGTLFVTVDNNVWLSEIVRYKRKEILERLQHSFGSEVIKRISFRVG